MPSAGSSDSSRPTKVPRLEVETSVTTMSVPRFLVKRSADFPSAKLPTRGSATAAGYDLYAATAAKIPARGKAVVSTGLSIAVPEGCYGRIAPRSGLGEPDFCDRSCWRPCRPTRFVSPKLPSIPSIQVPVSSTQTTAVWWACCSSTSPTSISRVRTPACPVDRSVLQVLTVRTSYPQSPRAIESHSSFWKES